MKDERREEKEIYGNDCWYCRFSRKFVVLDCGAELASEIIIQHVKDIQLGRRNYHYMLSGLVSV